MLVQILAACWGPGMPGDPSAPKHPAGPLRSAQLLVARSLTDRGSWPTHGLKTSENKGNFARISKALA